MLGVAPGPHRAGTDDTTRAGSVASDSNAVGAARAGAGCGRAARAIRAGTIAHAAPRARTTHTGASTHTSAARPIARSAQAYLPNLKLGVHLGERRPSAWLVRDNSPELKAALNGFLKANLQVNAAGRTRRSKMYGTIYDRYFENPLTIQRFQEPTHRPDKSGILSAYDDLIRRKSEAVGLDWRMVAALIYQEFEFHPEARSKADARGLMQVLPRFAGDQADSLFLPEPNLTAGLRLMENTYSNYAYLDSLDRWRFTLAEYHARGGKAPPIPLLHLKEDILLNEKHALLPASTSPIKFRRCCGS